MSGLDVQLEVNKASCALKSWVFHSLICMPLCNAMIFCCCCSRRLVSAFTCLRVSSNTTAFSKCPSV